MINVVKGKTMFLFYLLVHLLQCKQIILFSVDSTRLFSFYFGKVWTVIVHPALKLLDPRSRAPTSFPIFI